MRSAGEAVRLTRSLTAPLDSGSGRAQRRSEDRSLPWPDPAMRPKPPSAPLGVYLMVSDGYGACEFYKRALGPM